MTASETTKTDNTIDLTKLETVERWADGVAGPCPICEVEVLQGDDCPEAHYSKALDFALGNKANLIKAVNILRNRRDEGLE